VSASLEAPCSPAWQLQRLDQVESTNDLAGRLPGWHAVTARTQTRGRGRYRRNWVSDIGGIWISATLPTPAPAEQWAVLPLAAGWALRAAIESLGVSGLRLRWPNDLMRGRTKLAGILVERFTPSTAVVGIGINYLNDPVAAAPELAGTVVRLADLLDPLPPEELVIASLLAHLAEAQHRIEIGAVEAFLPALNEAWQIDRVSLQLSSSRAPVIGKFKGVDAAGNLLVLDESGANRVLSPLDVELLREL